MERHMTFKRLFNSVNISQSFSQSVVTGATA